MLPTALKKSDNGFAISELTALTVIKIRHYMFIVS